MAIEQETEINKSVIESAAFTLPLNRGNRHMLSNRFFMGRLSYWALDFTGIVN